MASSNEALAGQQLLPAAAPTAATLALRAAFDRSADLRARGLRLSM